MKNLCKCGNSDIGMLLIRLSIGAIFIMAAIGKFSNLESAIGFFSSLNLPVFTVYLVSSIEILGGIAMIFGVFTHWAGKLLAFIMLMTIILVHWNQGFVGYQFQMLLFASALAIVFVGPGKYTIKLLRNKK